MFKIGMYVYVFYCLCYVKYISTYILEEQVLEDRDPDLNEEENIRIEESRGGHWGDVSEYGEDKSNMHSLRWFVYTVYKEELIKRCFSMSVPHPKGGNIFWTCVKDNIIE